MHTMFQGMARSSSAKSADTLSDSIAVRPRACFANSPIAPLAARLMRSLTTENGSSQPPCSPVPSHRHELATDARRSDSTHPAVRETAQNPLTRRSNLGIPPRRLSTTTQTTNFIAITPAPTTATLLALSLAAIETRPGRTTNQSGPPAAKRPREPRTTPRRKHHHNGCHKHPSAGFGDARGTRAPQTEGRRESEESRPPGASHERSGREHRAKTPL